MEGRLAICIARVEIAAVLEQELHDLHYALLGRPVQRAEAVRIGRVHVATTLQHRTQTLHVPRARRLPHRGSRCRHGQACYANEQ